MSIVLRYQPFFAFCSSQFLMEGIFFLQIGTTTSYFKLEWPTKKTQLTLTIHEGEWTKKINTPQKNPAKTSIRQELSLSLSRFTHGGPTKWWASLTAPQGANKNEPCCRCEKKNAVSKESRSATCSHSIVSMERLRRCLSWNQRMLSRT